MKYRSSVLLAIAVASALCAFQSARAALLAYEPFTNAPGSAILGSGGGTGFSQVWQTNGSGGVATNLAFGLGYTDSSNNVLVVAGNAAFFQGLTTANTSMQPCRLFDFSRGTNAAEASTTWISFLVVRQGPTGTLAGNPYGRGANVCHDLSSNQKLAVGNSSAATTNTVGLIPAGNSANLKSSTNTFGGCTNFVVVRIDHVSGANDSAWLFVNPNLAAEPSTNSANASSLGGFDFSFNRLRVFSGGHSSTTQPYAELIVDEYRVGETYADVTPHTGPTPSGPIVINRVTLSGANVVLAGTGGPAGGTFLVLTSTNCLVASSNWPAVVTNQFDAGGAFTVHLLRSV